MSNLANITIGYTFNGDAAAANYVNASQLDTQLAALATAQNATKAALDGITDSANNLAAATVGFSQLRSEIRNTLLSTYGSSVLTAAKVAVRLVANVNVPVLSGLVTIDGVVTVAGDAVLLTAQTTASQNGLWVVAAGAWARRSDLPAGASQGNGWYVIAYAGVALTGSAWGVYTPGTNVVGTDTMSFVSLSAVTALASTVLQALTVQNPSGLTVRQAPTTDAIVVKPANVGTGLNTITDTTPATALGANFTQTRQAKSGTVALQETSTLHGFKNMLHNGRVEVDQRNTLTTPVNVPTNTITYGPDGWVAYHVNATQVMTLGKVAVVNTPMVGSLYACKLNVTTGSTVAAGDATFFRRVIEGTFSRRLNWGTAQAAPLYISFWVESTITGTFGVSIKNNGSTRTYVTTFTISSINTRQLCQVTIPGDTAGAWLTDTSWGIGVDFCFATGSSQQTTAGTWQGGSFFGTSSCTNFFAAANSVQISDLYLGTEPIGAATTDYPHVPYDVELLRCMRYLPSIQPTGSATQYVGSGPGLSATTAVLILPFTGCVPRVPPTGILTTAIGGFRANDASSGTALTAISWVSAGPSSATVNIVAAAGLTQYRPYFLEMTSTASLLFLGCEL
jgi:hypothetical protein